MADDLGVEIGPRQAPFLEAIRPDLKGKRKFVLLEKSKVWKSRDEVVRPYLDVEPVRGDATKMPFADNSLGLGFSKDLFSSGGLYQDRKGEFHQGTVNLEKIASEIYRVLKPGAKFVLFEYSLPQNVEFRAFAHYLKGIFEEANLGTAEEYVGPEAAKVFNKEFDNLATWDSVALVFEKPIK